MKKAVPLKQDPTQVYNISVGNFTEVGFIAHAVQQMKRRRIKETQVFNALQSPVKTSMRADFPHQGCVARLGRKKLCVVYDENGQQLTVVSAYWKD